MVPFVLVIGTICLQTEGQKFSGLFNYYFIALFKAIINFYGILLYKQLIIIINNNILTYSQSVD